MKNINIFTFIPIILLLIGFSINFVYANPSTTYIIPIHTDAYTSGGYMGGAHVIGSGSFANTLQSGLSASADRFGIRKKPGVGTTAVNQSNATLSVARNAGVTNAALIEVGAHALLLDQYGGTPTGVANSPYVDDLINNVIAPNVGDSGRIIIPMDHTRTRIPDTPGGNTYINANATGAREHRGYSERDTTDAIAAKIKARFGDRVVIIKPEDYDSYQAYDAAITSAAGGAAVSAAPGAAPSGAPGGVAPGTSSSPSTTAGTVNYESYTNFPGVGRIRDLCQLINALWLLGFVVLLTSVLGMFLYGGYIYVTAGVNAGKVNQAKEIFTNTITGLIIGLSIFIIINIINPGLLQGNCSIPSAGSGTPGTPSTPGGGGGGGENPPITGDTSARIAAAAESLIGMDTTGSGLGPNACNWAVNKVMEKAGVPAPWGSSIYVPTTRGILDSGKGIKLSGPEPGAIAIMRDYVNPPYPHIGVVLNNGKIVSNSNSKGAFSWVDTPAAYDAYYGRSTEYWRIP